MVRHVLLILLFSTSFFASSSQLSKDELKAVYSLTKTNLDSAYSLSYELLKECTSNDDYFGLVKLNYLLGFLHDRDGDIGKSVLHYLEAIRYTEYGQYESVNKDAIDIKENIAYLYKRYKANDFASQYFKGAIEIADWMDDSKKVILLKFNLALTYVQAERNNEAIDLFGELLTVASKNRKYRIINELGLIYKNTGDFESAKKYFTQLQNLEGKHRLYSAKALHNLGRMEYSLGNHYRAIELINESINIKEEIDSDQRSLFISYKTLGQYLFDSGDLAGSSIAYKSAENLIDAVKTEALSFELYRSISQLNYENGDAEQARKYSDLYSKTVDEYLESQQELQNTDRQYNMDLITKRYLDQVAKQEQIASILLYSKVISGSLLALLLLTIAYNWYQKVQLRKSIMEDLIRLKVVE